MIGVCALRPTRLNVGVPEQSNQLHLVGGVQILFVNLKQRVQARTFLNLLEVGAHHELLEPS